MKRIEKSKNPSIQQMLNMASNLEEKFNKSSMIVVNAHHFSAGPFPNRASYTIYIEGVVSSYHEDWKEVLKRYFSIMEGDSND